MVEIGGLLVAYVSVLQLGASKEDLTICERASCYALTNHPRVHTGTLDVLASSYLQRVQLTYTVISSNT